MSTNPAWRAMWQSLISSYGLNGHYWNSVIVQPRLIHCQLGLVLLTFHSFTLGNRRVDVQVEAIFTLVVQVSNQALQVVKSSHCHVLQSLLGVVQIRQNLRTHRGKLGDLSQVRPRLRRGRRHEPQRAGGCSGVGYSQESVDEAKFLVAWPVIDAKASHCTLSCHDSPARQGRPWRRREAQASQHERYLQPHGERKTLNGNKKHKTTSQEFIFSFGGASISPRPETDYRMKKLLKNRKTQTLSSNKTKQKKKDSSIFAQNQQQRQRQQQHQHMTKADELMTASNKEGLQLLLLRLLHLLLRFLKTVWAAAGTNFFDTTASTENISFSFSTDDQNVTFDFGKKSTEARAAAAARNSGPPINIHMHQKNQGEKGAQSHATCTKDARY